jgi:purine nucleosidase
MKLQLSTLLRIAALSAALLAAQLAGGPCALAHAGTRPKVIFDEDEMGPGGTNIQATLMLAEDRSIDLLGITVPTGDGWRNEEVAHVLRALQIAHRASIPVYPGAEFPLLNTVQRTQAWEKMYGKLFYDGAFMHHWPAEGTQDWTPLHPNRPNWVPPLPEGEPTIHARSENAALFMIRMVHKYPHQVTIIAAGPMTDIALAASLDPRFATLAKELVFMGGSFNPQVGKTPFAHLSDYVNDPRQEFNVRFDPEAAAIMLQQPWHKIIEVPVDATQSTTLMSRKMLAAVARGSAPFDHYLARFGQVYPLWDETAVAVWLDPALVTHELPLQVTVDTNFTDNYGTLESWPRGDGPRWADLVHVVFAVNVPKLDRLVLRLLTAPKPIALHFPAGAAH